MDNPIQPTKIPEVQTQTPPPVNHSSNTKLLIFILAGVAVTLISIGAYVLGTKQSQPVVQNNVQTTPTPPPTPIDEIANWKTYVNTKYGYSLNYPQAWSVKELDSTFKSKIVAGQMVSMTEIGNNEAKIQIFFEGEFDSGLIAIEFEKYEKINLDKKVASKEVFHKKGELNSKWIGISIDNFNSFRIEFQGSSSSLPTLDQILSTFKFTDQNQTLDTSSWKTYESVKAKYSFKYPAEWPLVNVPLSAGCDTCIETIIFTPKYNINTVENHLAVISVVKEDKIKTLQDFVVMHVRGDSSKVILQYSNIGEEQSVSYRLSGGIPPLPIIEHAVVANGFQYTVGLEDSVEANKDRDKNVMIFNHILSTFQFTSP